MEAAEFERIAGESGSATTQARAIAQPPNVEAIRAVYEARLAGDALADGKAALEIRHVEKGPAFLRMDPCRLPIQSPRWLDETRQRRRKGGDLRRRNRMPTADPLAVGTPLSQIAPQPAILGVGADGKLVLRVERSGTQEFDWSLVGRRETGAAPVFDLAASASREQ